MYKLPKLSYSLEELEPYIDTHTMGIHYHKHHQNYLNQLNNILNKYNYDYSYNLVELLYHIDEFKQEDRENILFNLGGVLNHNLYWESISPNKENPSGNLLKQIESQYGSLDGLFDTIKKMALILKGSGYTFLVINDKGELEVVNTSNQYTPLLNGDIPLLNVDMWEHAYYLNYKNEKGSYLDNFKMIMDFKNANKIYNEVIKK